MDIKYISVSDAVSIPVPNGLTPDEEANYIANRIAFVNVKDVETQCAEALQALDEGKLRPFDQLLNELEREPSDKM